MRLLLPLLALTVIWAEPLHAHGLGEAEARYRQGDFLVAAELGRTLASTDGDTLAARATLVEAAFRAQKDDKSRLFELAAADARRALARDPEHVDAHLQLALALGHLGESNGPIEGHLQGYAREGKRRLDRALGLDRTTPGRRARRGCGTSKSCGTQALRSPANSTVRRSKRPRALRPRARTGAREHRAALWLRRLAAGARSRRRWPTGGRTDAYGAAPATARCRQAARAAPQAQRLLGEAGGSSY
jgi:hypothetical protein